jgi:mannan endo-1,4-beta-mannosidase
VRRVCVSSLMGMLSALCAIAQPPDLVTAVGDEFAKDGKAYRFVGMNLRGLSHYGGGIALPYTSTGHIDENLAGVAGLGGRVVRIFAANKHVSHQESVNRLGYALDRAHAHGLKLIIALTDFYPTSFHPPGDDQYYTQNQWGWTVLNHTWFAGGYQNNYLPWVTLAVNTHKNHPAVFSWQLGNEIADQSSGATHDAFVHAMAAHIKSIDPYHMVSIGMLSMGHIPGYTTQQGVTLYSDANLDFITAHRYDDQRNLIDFQVRDLVNKPILMSEVGCNAGHPAVGGNRVAFMDGRINLFVHNLGARGMMNWGYQAQSFDIGDGDNTFGIDHYAHNDYDAMVNMYAGHAAILNAYDEPVGVPPPPGPRGRNLALGAVNWNADTIFSGDFAGDKAFDDDLSTKWTSTDASSVHWLSLDLGQPYILTGFRPQLAGAGNEWIDFNLVHYQLQTGSGPSGPWTTVADVHNAGQANAIATSLSPAIIARYVRIWIDDCGIDNYARLPELEVIGDPDPIGDLDTDGDTDLADCGLLQLQADQPWPTLADIESCVSGPDIAVPLSCY